MRGTVVFFSDARGYGFIKPNKGGNDVFVHFEGIIGKGFRTLMKGDCVEFDVNPEGPKGKPCAANVRVIEGSK